MKKISLATTVLFLTLLSTPAQAHDLLVEITPADGEVVTSSSFQATLTFSNDLLSIDGEQNSALETKLSGTEEWVSHAVLIAGPALTAQIELAESGNYDLRWKVVSSDGHAITGESTLVLELPVEQASPEPALLISPASEPDTGIPGGFYVGLALVALGAVFAPIGLMIRRRAKKS